MNEHPTEVDDFHTVVVNHRASAYEKKIIVNEMFPAIILAFLLPQRIFFFFLVPTLFAQHTTKRVHAGNVQEFSFGSPVCNNVSRTICGRCGRARRPKAAPSSFCLVDGLPSAKDFPFRTILSDAVDDLKDLTKANPIPLF